MLNSSTKINNSKNIKQTLIVVPLDLQKERITISLGLDKVPTVKIPYPESKTACTEKEQIKQPDIYYASILFGGASL